MQGRPRDALNSWVVNAETGEPTGYVADRCDPWLRRHPEVLRTPGEIALLVVNVDVFRRRAFAGFLDQLARKETSAAEAHMIEHYQDRLLEAVRAECVRLLYDARDPLAPSDEAQEQLRAWTVALRASAEYAP